MDDVITQERWVRDADGSLVMAGAVYSQTYGARLWRLPTQFLMNRPPDWLPGLFPWLVWGGLGLLVARLVVRLAK